MTDSDSKSCTLWNKLVSEGIERGYVTYKEINDALPYDEIDPEVIESILVTLDNAGIEIIEETKIAEFKARTRQQKEETTRKEMQSILAG